MTSRRDWELRAELLKGAAKRLRAKIAVLEDEASRLDDAAEQALSVAELMQENET